MRSAVRTSGHLGKEIHLLPGPIEVCEKLEDAGLLL